MWPESDALVPDAFSTSYEDGYISMYRNQTLDVVTPKGRDESEWIHSNLIKFSDFLSSFHETLILVIGETFDYGRDTMRENFSIGGKPPPASPSKYVVAALKWFQARLWKPIRGTDYAEGYREASVYLYHLYAIMYTSAEILSEETRQDRRRKRYYYEDLIESFRHFIFLTFYFNLLITVDPTKSQNVRAVRLTTYYFMPESVAKWKKNVEQYFWDNGHGRRLLDKLEEVRVEDRASWNRSKLMIVGQGRAGKTATVRSLLGESFEPEWESTVGASLKQTTTMASTAAKNASGWSTPENYSTFTADHALQMAMKKLLKQRHTKSNVRYEKSQLRPRKAKSSVKMEQEKKENEAQTEEMKKGKQRTSRRKSLFNMFRRGSKASSMSENEDTDLKENVKSDSDPESVHELSESESESETEVMSNHFGYITEARRFRQKNGFSLVENQEVMARYGSKFFSALNRSIAEKDDSLDFLAFTIWDYGGQKVFYTLHHLFLTEHGVYLLVFDMRQFLRKSRNASEDAKEYLEFWLNSISLHAPGASILMVGTYLDSVDTGDDDELTVKLKSISLSLTKIITKRKRKNPIVRNSKLGIAFFPVDNTKREGNYGIENLQKMIIETAQHQDYVKRQVSLRWTKCVDLILKETEEIMPPKPKTKRTVWEEPKPIQVPRNHVSYDRVVALAKSIGIVSREEVDEMLRMFHDLGIVLHLTATETLRNMVIINPQWLIDKISKVIRDDEIHRFDEKEIQNVGLEADVMSMFKDGLASKDLLEYLWDKEHVPYMIDLMRETLLLSEWKFSDIQEKKYLIPSLLLNCDKEVSTEEMKKQSISCVFDFTKGFLPVGVFQRLVCLFVAISVQNIKSEEAIEPSLSKDSAKIWFGEFGFIVLRKRESKIFLHMNKPKYCSRHLSVFQSLLNKIEKDATKGKRLEYACFLQNPEKDPPFISLQESKEIGLKPWFHNKAEESEIISSASSKNLDAFLENF